MTRVIVCRSSWRQTDFYHEPAADDPSEPACRFRGRENMSFRTVELDSLGPDAEECSFCAGTAESHGGGTKLAEDLKDPEVGPEDLGLTPVEGKQ
jgi:hypothetical protein